MTEEGSKMASPSRDDKGTKGRVLIVDDEPSLRQVIEVALRRDYSVSTAADFAAAIAQVDTSSFDLVLTDLQLPDGDGIALLRRVKEVSPETSVIVLTAHGSTDTAVAAMRCGAHDYITKPFDLDELRIRIEQAIEGRRLRRENRALRAEVTARNAPEGIVGNSLAITRVIERIRAVADSNSTVLILGESGTGKELVARSIHSLSSRNAEPFVAVNCGALTETLLEAELFGHVRGAFTDAGPAKAGLIENANGGTLFLDELAETSLAMQVRLLRVLQERRVRRVGSSEESAVDVRIVAATNRDLAELVSQGKFREDLYYRINVIPITVPPLRDRTEDIPILAETFVTRFAKQMNKPVLGVSPEAMSLLMSHAWRGNVRELQNTLERAVTFEKGDTIGPESLFLSPAARPAGLPMLGEGFSLPDYLADLEKKLAQRALEMAEGKRSDAAKLLGINYRALKHILSKP
jgi:DNA-binding NtrC family response regulator